MEERKMKVVKLVARESIEGIKDDTGLRALNGYYESNVEEFQDEVEDRDIVETLCEKYYEEYKHLFSPKFELEFLN